MIEIIKELGSVLKELPDMAIWILIGVLFYKTVIIGSVYGVIRLAIVKLHDVFSGSTKVVLYEVKGGACFSRETKDLLDDFLVKEVRNGVWINKEDIERMIKIYKKGKRVD